MMLAPDETRKALIPENNENIYIIMALSAL